MISDQNTLLPYGRQTITDDDVQAVVKVLKSPFLTQGPLVQQFENVFSQKVGATYGIAVNSATSALHIACLALELAPGDSLWTSPITFVASANCGRYCGANVDFVDIDTATGLMSISALEQKLIAAKKNGTLPKIVVPVHLAGASCDMKAIASLSKEYGFKIIEDASHAVGAYYQKQPIGSCEYSSICVFSFHPVKIITTIEGGLATTNSNFLAKRMTELRSHGIVKDESMFIYPSAGPWAYEQQDLGFNYRMSDVQAALGLSQLERLDYIVRRRNELFRTYHELLRDAPLALLKVPHDVISSVHLAVVLLNSSSHSFHRQVFISLRQAGIGVQLHYTPVHLQPYYRNLGFQAGQFPCSESYATRAISLPLYPSLTIQEQQRVVSSLSDAIAKASM